MIYTHNPSACGDTAPSGRIKLTIAYDGTDYHGWQVQKGAITVQSTLQDAVESVCGTRFSVTGCSRTDAGVHANEFVCHTEALPIPCDRLPQAINSRLPGSIAVKKAEAVSHDFHARYSCLGKEYIYKFFNEHYRDPFLLGKAAFYPKKLDTDALNTALSAIVGKHDFRAFMAEGSKITDTVRTVKYCELVCGEHNGGKIVTLRIAADGFLYNMVRIIAGTVLLAAEKGLKKDDIAQIVASRDRRNAGATAPACGLYLNKVFYE